MKHFIYLHPGRPDDGAQIGVSLLASKLDGHAVAIIVPTERVNGLNVPIMPVVIEEGRLLTQNIRG